MRIEIVRNNNARLLEPSCRIHRNCIQLKYKQSKAHFMTICEKAWELFTEGHSFYTEAKLEHNQARGDLFDIDDSIVYEKMISEKMESIKQKERIWKNHGINLEVML